MSTLSPSCYIHTLTHAEIIMIVPTNISVWSWLFGSALLSRKNASQGTLALPNDRGFRDATTGRLLTYQDAHDNSIWLSIALAQLHGLQAHQTVAIVSANSISYPVAMFAAGRLGAVVAALPHEANAKDLSYFFQASSTVMVFTTGSSSGQVREACQMVGLSDQRIIRVDGTPERKDSIQGLIEYGKNLGPSKFVEEWTPAENASAACAFLSFTSGTTGRPKAVWYPTKYMFECKCHKGRFICLETGSGVADECWQQVMISHTNIISQLCQMRQLSPPSKQTTVLGVLPFHHSM
jgi:4-coumarate--CoA ligase